MIIDDLILEKCIGNGKRGEVYLTTKKGDDSNKYVTKKNKKLQIKYTKKYVRRRKSK